MIHGSAQTYSKIGSVKQAIIVLTDGQASSGTDKVQKAASELQKQLQATMFSIGVGSGTDQIELNLIASEPDNMFQINDFQALQTILPKLSSQVCKNIHFQTATAKSRTECRHVIFDLTVIVDGSGSISSEDYRKSIDFVNQILQTLDVSTKGVNVRLFQFSDRVRDYTNGKPSGNKKSLTVALNAMAQDHINSVTYTNKALDLAYDQIMSSNSKNYGHNHLDRKQVVIILTDGQSTDKNVSSARKLHNNANAKIFAIGIGSGVDKNELSEMASDPDRNYMFEISDYDALTRILAKLTEEVCVSVTDRHYK